MSLPQTLPLLGLATAAPGESKTDILFSAATRLAAQLDQGATISRRDLSQAMQDAFATTDATGT